MARTSLSKEAQRALADVEELGGDHREWISRVKDAEDAYDGLFERSAEVASWVHKETPRYVQHIVETSIAAMLDPDFKFQVKPRPKMYEPPDWERAKKGAKALEILLGFQLDQDRFAEKQRDLVLQERLGGIAWIKVHWHRSTRLRKRLQTGYDGGWPRTMVTEEPETLYDGPCIEVLNNRDAVWDFGATCPETMSVFGHTTWVTYEEAVRNEKAGRWKNVEKLKDGERAASGQEDREQRQRNRLKVTEIWKREAGGINVYTIGEESVLLQEREHPYWHGMMPFIPFASRKKPLQVKGWSQVESLKDIQQQLWSVENLTLDALMLSIMPIIMIRNGVDDPDAFKFEPYARWEVDTPEDIRMWTPENSQAQVGLPHIQRLQATMQNISGSQPFTSTSEARSVQANTATEASLVSSIAQRSMSNAKSHLYQTYERAGQQMLELNQQYVRDPVYLEFLDLDQPGEIDPRIWENLDFSFSVKPMTESLLRQERRSEAITFFQSVIQAAPVFAAMQTPLDVVEILRVLTDSFDLGDAEQFLAKPQGQQLPAQGSPPAPPGPGGVTNPQLAAGLMSPSNEASLSGMNPMQQLLAAGSGARNA